MDQATLPPGLGIKTFSISYNLTRLDMYGNRLTLIYRNRILLVMHVLLVIFIDYTTVSGPEFQKMPLLPLIIGLIIFTVLFLCGLFLFQAVLMALIVFSKKDPGLVGNHLLELGDEGLIESTTVNRNVCKYAAIYKVISRRFYYYIYVGSDRYYQVPKREIPAGQLEIFDGELRRRVEASRK